MKRIIILLLGAICLIRCGQDEFWSYQYNGVFLCSKDVGFYPVEADFFPSLCREFAASAGELHLCVTVAVGFGYCLDDAHRHQTEQHLLAFRQGIKECTCHLLCREQCFMVSNLAAVQDLPYKDLKFLIVNGILLILFVFVIFVFPKDFLIQAADKAGQESCLVICQIADAAAFPCSSLSRPRSPPPSRRQDSSSGAPMPPSLSSDDRFRQ